MVVSYMYYATLMSHSHESSWVVTLCPISGLQSVDVTWLHVRVFAEIAPDTKYNYYAIDYVSCHHMPTWDLWSSIFDAV